MRHKRQLAHGPTPGRRVRIQVFPVANASGDVDAVFTIATDVHDLTVAQERLRRRVERDALTDELSRRTMMDRVEAAIADSVRQPVALYFVDLDGFKAVNDRLGHGEGDALLVAVAAALQGAVRAEDAVGRCGGDEFLVLAPVRHVDEAQALALHLLTSISSVTGSSQLTGVVGASIGYALAPADARQPLQRLQLADDAMYSAKRFGRNQAMHCASIPFEATR